MFYAEDKTRLRRAMRRCRAARGALPLRFRGNQRCCSHEGIDGMHMTKDWHIDFADVPVALLAGGLATRLRPITRESPRRWSKSPAGRLSIISSTCCTATAVHRECFAWVIWRAGRQACRRRFKQWRGRAIQLRRRQLLGTGGALRRALPLLGEAFWVLYGDSYLDFDYRGGF